MNNNITEIEEIVLGAIILEGNSALDVVKNDLNYKCFTHEPNKLIFASLIDLDKENKSIDLITIVQKLREKKQLDLVGGAFYVSSLTQRVASSANIYSHARYLIENYLKSAISSKLMNAFHSMAEPNADPLDVQAKLITDLQDLVNEVSTPNTFETIESLGDKYLTDLSDLMDGKGEVAISTGFTEMDRYGMYGKSDFILIAGRPGMGKTAYIISSIRNICFRNGIKTGMFSLEMSSMQILNRIISSENQINSEALRKGTINRLEFSNVNGTLLRLKDKPFWIDSTSSIDIDVLCARAKQMKRNFGIQILFIDYIGLINTGKYGNDKTNQTGYISNRLKGLAKDLNIPIICLSQLSRDIEKRPINERMPRSSDLRNSGDLEQDADSIYFLFRPMYYGVNEWEINGQMIDVTNKCFVINAKNRHVGIGTELLGFVGQYTEFYSLVDEQKKMQSLEPSKDFF